MRMGCREATPPAQAHASACVEDSTPSPLCPGCARHGGRDGRRGRPVGVRRGPARPWILARPAGLEPATRGLEGSQIWAQTSRNPGIATAS
jgi:hypothetical protein